MGQLFENPNFSTSDGSIDNLLDPFDGWRLASQSEWASIVGTTRSGSTVNGNDNKHYAFIRLTGVNYDGYSSVKGMLIFPDGEIITGKTLSAIDSTASTTDMIQSELDVYLKQGYVFLPACGYVSGSSFTNQSNYGYYWSSDVISFDPSMVYYLYYDSSNINASAMFANKTNYYLGVRLVKPIS